MIYLTPFGYDPSHVLSGIVEKGITEKDTVVLVVPETNLEQERFKESKREIENFLETIKNPKLEILTVNHQNFESAVLKITEFISKKEEKIFLNASQAAREVLLSTVIAALFQREKIEDFIIFSNVDRKNIDAELPKPVNMTENQKEHLKAIEEGSTVTKLAKEKGWDKSTASRRVKKLNELNLVKTEKDGRKKIISLTLTGKIYKKIY